MGAVYANSSSWNRLRNVKSKNSVRIYWLDKGPLTLKHVCTVHASVRAATDKQSWMNVRYK